MSTPAAGSAGPTPDAPGAAATSERRSATSERRTERRAVILAAARELLRDQGWHAVGVDEIGTASGVSGPAVYRYFPSKEALLTEALTHAAEELWNTAPPDPDAPLEAWVTSHVRFVLANVDLVELWYAEARHLPPAALAQQRRLQRRYLDGWGTALHTRRPDLPAGEVVIRVRGAVGLIHAVAHADRRTRAWATAPLLTRLALAALDA
jgi:AcrR family transcriptional regulator